MILLITCTVWYVLFSVSIECLEWCSKVIFTSENALQAEVLNEYQEMLQLAKL